MNIESVWQQYSRTLHGFLAAKISDPQDVQDVLQEILIATHQHLHTLESKACLKPWLLKVAKHALIDFYRKNGRKDNALKLLELDQQSQVDSSIDLQKCLLPFIRQLPEDNAKLLIDIDINHISQ